MGTITISSSTLNKNFVYENEQVIINGSYQLDNDSKELKNINGTCYRPSKDEKQGEYMCNFNGYLRDGEIKYTFTDLSRKDTVVVLDATDEIEQYIKDND